MYMRTYDSCFHHISSTLVQHVIITYTRFHISCTHNTYVHKMWNVDNNNSGKGLNLKMCLVCDMCVTCVVRVNYYNALNTAVTQYTLPNLSAKGHNGHFLENSVRHVYYLPMGPSCYCEP